jgi:hypothetical protein
VRVQKRVEVLQVASVSNPVTAGLSQPESLPHSAD